MPVILLLIRLNLSATFDILLLPWVLQCITFSPFPLIPVTFPPSFFLSSLSEWAHGCNATNIAVTPKSLSLSGTSNSQWLFGHLSLLFPRDFNSPIPKQDYYYNNSHPPFWIFSSYVCISPLATWTSKPEAWQLSSNLHSPSTLAFEFYQILWLLQGGSVIVVKGAEPTRQEAYIYDCRRVDMRAFCSCMGKGPATCPCHFPTFLCFDATGKRCLPQSFTSLEYQAGSGIGLRERKPLRFASSLARESSRLFKVQPRSAGLGFPVGM